MFLFLTPFNIFMIALVLFPFLIISPILHHFEPVANFSVIWEFALVCLFDGHLHPRSRRWRSFSHSVQHHYSTITQMHDFSSTDWFHYYAYSWWYAYIFVILSFEHRLGLVARLIGWYRLPISFSDSFSTACAIVHASPFLIWDGFWQLWGGLLVEFHALAF